MTPYCVRAAVWPVPPYPTAIAVPFHVPDVMVARVALPVAPRVVNAPEEGVVPPIAVPLIVPPVMVTELAFWVDIVPRPVMSPLGIDETAVKALVPLPFKYPVSVVAPVPPCGTVMVPEVI